MNDERYLPIAISGWSGVGTSTVALQVAWIWKRKYYYFGKLFRDLGEKLGFQNEGMDRVQADDYLEKVIGKVVDKYVDFLLLSGRNILVESDIACFRLKKREEFLSVFLYADEEIRAERVIEDSRGQNAKQVLEMRDRHLKSAYQELWGVDIFDMETVNNSYTYVINSGNLSVKETVSEVCSCLAMSSKLDVSPDIGERIEYISDIYDQKGKSGVRDELKRETLIADIKDIAQEIGTIHMDDIMQLPPQIREYFVV